MTTGNGDGFTVKEIVIEIRRDVNRLIERIDRIDRQGSIGTKQELDDHEERIRGLESDRWKARGALTLAAAVIPVVITIAVSIWL